MASTPASTLTFTAKASTQQWIQQFGTGTVSNGDDQGDTLAGLATDPQGNVIAAGFTTGAFPGFSNPNGVPEDFVAKFSPTGSQLWLQQFGTGSGDQLSGVAVDSNGNIFVAGVTQGAFPGFANASHNPQIMVEKLDGSGHQLWLQQLQFAPSAQVAAIAVDGQGNVLVSGEDSPYQGSSAGVVNIFVEKLNGGTGATEWFQQFGNSFAVDGVSDMAVDGEGNPVLVGFSSGAFPGTENPVNSPIPFVLKLAASTGQTIWIQQTVDATALPGFLYNAVAVDSQGNVDVDGEGDVQANAQCMAFQYDGATGAPHWQQSFGGAQQCLVGGLALDSDGNLLVGGYTPGAFLPAFTAMTDDIFLAKLSSSGQAVSVQQFGTGKEVAQQDSVASANVSVATDAQNHTFVGGMTTGAFPGASNAKGAQEIFLAKFGPQ
jgi:hypothetical protein